jgi:hypothetical protein
MELELSNKDKYIIAEYVYSWQSDILIKSDAERLIDVFDKHELIKNKKSWLKDVEDQSDNIAVKLMLVLENNISDDVGNKIMDDYRAGKLTG